MKCEQWDKNSRYLNMNLLTLHYYGTFSSSPWYLKVKRKNVTLYLKKTTEGFKGYVGQ